MVQYVLDFLGLALPEIQWSTQYTVNPTTFYQYAAQAVCVLAVVLVVSLLGFIISSIQSISRAR